MNCIIEGIDFYNLDAMKYYSVPSSWSAEKEKDNAVSKIFSNEWLGAQKRDGIFCMVGKNLDGEIFWRPRSKNTKGEFVNKVDWVPQFHNLLNELDPGTVLLGETYLPEHESAKDTTSIMNCLLPKSLKRQEKDEYRLHLYVFDVLAENGKSYLQMKAENRFDLLNSFARAYPDEYVEWARYYTGKELWNMLQNLLADGYEGMVITHKDALYQPGKRSSKISLKIKKKVQETIDCVIIKSNPPTKIYSGQEPEIWEYWFDEFTNEKILAKDFLEKNHTTIYEAYSDGATVVPVTKNWFYGWAGSLQLGLYNKNKQIVHVGDLSGITEEVRKNWRNYIGTVAEISCMEISEDKNGNKGFRHPRLISWRTDKNPKECSLEQIY